MWWSVLCFRLCIVIVAGLTGAMVVIQTSAAGDLSLRQVVAPLDCPLHSCFLGIQPGRTAPTEAIALLERHPWVSRVEYQLTSPDGEGWIRWHWNGSQPAFFNSGMKGYALIKGGAIETIGLQTAIPMSAVILLLGRHDPGNAYVVDRTMRRATAYAVRYVIRYRRGDLELGVTSRLKCPISVRSLWQTPVELDLSATPRQVDYAFSHWKLGKVC